MIILIKVVYRYPVINPIRYFIKKAKNKIFFKYNSKLFYKYDEIYEDDYIFFHFIMNQKVQQWLESFDWADQLSLIKLLSRQIPPPYVLLIKSIKGMKDLEIMTFINR